MIQNATIDGLPLLVSRFSSLSAMADYCEANVGAYPYARVDGQGFRGAAWSDALTYARQGKAGLVAASDALLSKLEDAVGYEAGGDWQMQGSVVGALPSVPDFLSGNPVNMRLRRRVASQRAPLAVILNIGAASGCEAHQIARRGAAVLALVRLLAARRPVTLVLMSGHSEQGKHTLNLVDMDTAPLDLARAAWAVSAPEMLRRFHFILSCTAAPVIRGSEFWPLTKTFEGRHDLAAKFLGFEEYVACNRLSEGDFRTDAEALDWVRSNVALHLAE